MSVHVLTLSNPQYTRMALGCTITLIPLSLHMDGPWNVPLVLPLSHYPSQPNLGFTTCTHTLTYIPLSVPSVHKDGPMCTQSTTCTHTLTLGCTMCTHTLMCIPLSVPSMCTMVHNVPRVLHICTTSPSRPCVPQYIRMALYHVYLYTLKYIHIPLSVPSMCTMLHKDVPHVLTLRPIHMYHHVYQVT